MSNTITDGNGNLHVGDYNRASKGRITADFAADDLDGIGLDVNVSPNGPSERSAIKLGDYILAQDTAKTGSKNFGITNEAGAVLANFLTADGRPTSPQILYRSHVPLLIAGSCTIGDNGALSSHVALLPVYTTAWVWIKTGGLFTSSPAGWYWSVWSTSQAATIYQETWDGISTPVPSPTATAWVKTGPGAYTGPTTLASYITLPFPAASVGERHDWNIKWASSGSGANVVTIHQTDSTGAVWATQSVTTNKDNELSVAILERGTNLQSFYGETIGVSTYARIAGAVAAQTHDAAYTMAISASKATATEWIIIERLTVTKT